MGWHPGHMYRDDGGGIWNMHRIQHTTQLQVKIVTCAQGTCLSRKTSWGWTVSSLPTSPSEGWTRTLRAEGRIYIKFPVSKLLVFLAHVKKKERENTCIRLQISYHCSSYFSIIYYDQWKDLHLPLFLETK